MTSDEVEEREGHYSVHDSDSDVSSAPPSLPQSDDDEY